MISLLCAGSIIRRQRMNHKWFGNKRTAARLERGKSPGGDVSVRSAGLQYLQHLLIPPRAELSKDPDYPEDKKHGEWNSQQPENECFSHDGLPFSSFA
jgi:hypothetical protein